MLKYLVVFHIIHDWPMSGRSEVTNNWMFGNLNDAKEWTDEKWLEEDVMDIQIYEYNGYQYALIDRRHREINE